MDFCVAVAAFVSPGQPAFCSPIIGDLAMIAVRFEPVPLPLDYLYAEPL